MGQDYPIAVDGDDSFVGGMDSFAQQSKLPPGEYSLAMNTICRGGIIQTRPGSQALPLHLLRGNNQGLFAFNPTSSPSPVLLAAVNGFVSASYAPFRSYQFLPDIQFNVNSKYVSWASCIQSTYIDPNGDIQFLDNPVNVVVMQDGATRAAYWDGANSGHLDPTLLETPVGLWMCWSNNRLWVSRGSQIFASDIGNPLSFTESKYLNEGRAFYLPGECTGIAETPDRKGIICFTSNTATLIQSSIQDRELWLQTPDFQQLILPDLGCVAPRSIVQQYGMLWWYSSRGLINLDDALRTHISSELRVRDMEMMQSKFTMDSDVSSVCGGSIENFLLHGVPCGDRQNTRIHVLDQAPAEDSPVGVWPSYWSGWRPIEFAKSIINGTDYIFILSDDYDGETRIWQLFTQDKTDGGIPITSFVATKQHFFGNRDYKKFKFAEVEFENILGQTAVAVGVAGLRGGYQKILEKDISSVKGQIYWDQQYGFEANLFASTSPQSRIVKTIDFPDPNDCNSDCIESDIKGLIDKAFSIVIMWSGVAGVSAYRLFSQTSPVAYEGTCELDEEDDRLKTPGGCGVLGLFSTLDPFETFYATAEFSVEIELIIAGIPTDPFILTFTSTQSSVISQLDADRKALASARFKANQAVEDYSN